MSGLPCFGLSYFKRNWPSVEIEVDGELHTFPLSDTFWTTCPEFRGGALKDWILRQGASAVSVNNEKNLEKIAAIETAPWITVVIAEPFYYAVLPPEQV
ncbi:MAG TPA: hypothetical protein VNH18_11280 [Bryobacteraceae bacterium]|jgi:hypothetical protein|nr:hypothetical protein [Bryobacteraceae bacterium]HXJ39851.1 hypothetical protein [Bryobacteraceae bacterium]